MTASLNSRITLDIVGGKDAPDPIPWQIFLRFKLKIEDDGCATEGFFSCGGTILDEETILTAAHCVVQPASWTGLNHCPETESSAQFRFGKLDLDESYIVAGTLNPRKVNESGEWRKNSMDKGTINGIHQQIFIKEAIEHPDYTDHTSSRYNRNSRNDIAILKLKEPLKFNNNVQRACLPDNTYDDVDQSDKIAVISGWGSTTTECKESVNELQYAFIPFVGQCTKPNTVYWSYEISDDMICAGVLKDGAQDAGAGDSGGPLVVRNENGNAVVVGAVSWARGCGLPEAPTAYARVTTFLSWIRPLMIQ